ncbi:OsmC family protein [Acidovorax lacteus]|uniref:OsmC family protein n=1 Tax=Acidovorax lacteus TaxID=1924988 RepID=A0ABP8LJI9_9BURK
MAHHTATVDWQRGPDAFVDRRYHRSHAWQFDGGLQVPVSSSPQVVPVPMSDPAAVDPEEAFVAALASCHMLWFLDLACRDGWRVDRYRDQAEGLLAPDAEGQLAVTEVCLRPTVWFDPARTPTPAEHAALHHRAHEACFLARSVRSTLRCEPVLGTPGQED